MTETYQIAKEFSNEKEYQAFKDDYCERCACHNNGCSTEALIKDVPAGLAEVWDDGKCMSKHHCLFFRMKFEEGKQT